MSTNTSAQKLLDSGFTFNFTQLDTAIKDIYNKLPLMVMKEQICICWLRRDLRLDDNAALYHALKSGTIRFTAFYFRHHDT